MGLARGRQACEHPRRGRHLAERGAAGPTNELNAIAFGDSNHGWAVGERDTTLSTVDGGMTWLPGSIGTGEDWQDVEFVSSQAGWVLSEGSILHTIDGGGSWVPESFDRPPLDLDDLYLVDSGHGWAVGDGGEVYIRR